jgi:hypothetical protein
MVTKLFLGYQPCQVAKIDKTNILRTIPVLILRELMGLGI